MCASMHQYVCILSAHWEWSHIYVYIYNRTIRREICQHDYFSLKTTYDYVSLILWTTMKFCFWLYVWQFVMHTVSWLFSSVSVPMLQAWLQFWWPTLWMCCGHELPSRWKQPPWRWGWGRWSDWCVPQRVEWSLSIAAWSHQCLAWHPTQVSVCGKKTVQKKRNDANTLIGKFKCSCWWCCFESVLS